MSTVSSPAALPHFIESLLKERHDHVAAIAVIDATMTRVTAALGGTSTPKPAAPAKPAGAKRLGRPPKATSVPKAPVGRRPRSGMTANDFVLTFITAKKNPTSQEINKHWKEAGRKGMADNNLSLLTKAKKLKRIPLGGGVRGSRYSLA